MSSDDLSQLVNLSVGVPDGIINCNRLNQLLHLLIGGVQDVQEALAARDVVVEEDLDGPEGQDRFGQIRDGTKRHSEMLLRQDEQLNQLEERLKQCCEGKTQTTEELTNLLTANEEHAKDMIRGLEDQIKAGQESMDGRLKLLEEMMTNIQRKVQETTEISQQNKEFGRRYEENFQKTIDLSKQMETLKSQMQDLIAQRDQMNDAVNRLVAEKNDMESRMDQLCNEKVQLGGLVDKLTEKAGILCGEPIESAGTTHQLLKDLNCIACDTDVVQRNRDDLPIVPTGKLKSKKVVRKMPNSEALARIRSKRAAGGSFTVIKPDERIFRMVNRDPCASSTASSSSHRDEPF